MGSGGRNRVFKRCGSVARLTASLFLLLASDLHASTREPAVRNMLEQFETCIKARDIEGLAGMLSPRDPEWSRSIIQQYSQFWQRTPHFECRFEVGGAIILEDDRIIVPVLRELTVFGQGSPFIETTWRSITFIEDDEGALRIAGDTKIDAAKTAVTDLDVNLDVKSHRMDVRARVRYQNMISDRRFFLCTLNASLDVHAVHSPGGAELTFRRSGDYLIVEFTDCTAPETEELLIDYSGDPGDQAESDGLRQAMIDEPVSFAIWTTNWYPCVSVCDRRSIGKLVFDVPSGTTVVCNGTLVSQGQYGRRSRQTFEVKTPVSYSFAAGDYSEKKRDRDGTEFSVHLLDRDRGHSGALLKALIRMVKHLSDCYGEYPYDSLKVIEIPGGVLGSIGGSSAQGMIFVPETMIEGDYFNMALLGHEIGHAWWGNEIRSADGKVIDEGLAQLSALLCIEHLQGEQAMRAFQRAGFPGFPQSAQYYFLVSADRPGRDYMLGDPRYGQSREMHSLAETKAASTYLMLRDLIGERPFFAGLKRIVREFRGKAVNLDDLETAWTVESGIDLTQFFNQWFRRCGAPEFDLKWEAKRAREGWLITCTITQNGEWYDVRADIRIEGRDEVVCRTVSISSTPAIVQFTTNFEPNGVFFDPDGKLLSWTPRYRMNVELGDALLLQSERRNTEAESAYSQFLSQHPEHCFGQLYFANFLFLNQDFDRAIQHYRLAVEHADSEIDFAPFTSFALLRIGQSHEILKRIKEAISTYEEIFRRSDIAGSHQLAREALRDLFARNDPRVLEKYTPDLRALWRQIYNFGM